MYVILVYDISTTSSAGQKRLPKVMKLCRQYLHHVQKSVFEGEITQAKLTALEITLKQIIDETNDYVIIYQFDNNKYSKRKFLGIKFDPTSNIL